MAAVIRVKRRIDEEPQNAFVLNCKKRKTDELSSNHQHSSSLSNSCETKTILKFAGTVGSQDDSITSHISKLTKEEAKSIATKKRVPGDATTRCREESKQNSQENRFKIVNCYRESDENHGEEPKSITVVDVESNAPVKEENSSTTATTSSTQNDAQQASNNFVYDLYLPENDLTEMDTNLVNDLISIHPYHDDLYEGRYFDTGYGESSSDSEDSNDENNSRNEYPDTDTGDDSIGDDDIRRAVNNLNIEDNLSSDYDNPYSDEDEDRYGSAYARYKKRISKQTSNDDDVNGSDYNDDDDDDSD